MNKNVKICAAAIACAGLVLVGCGQRPQEQPQKTVYTPEYAIPAEIGALAAGDDSFAVKNVQKKQDSPLDGKTIYWLGSSVTYGSAAGGESMADYLAARTGCKSVKEAVSGTTLYDDGGTGDSGAKSYTRRLVNGANFDKTQKVDAFICQISTNDARNDRLDKWGKVTGEDVLDKSEFDRKTTLGGVEYIIAYVIETWECPVYFYSGGWFGDTGTRKSTNPTGTNYGKLVAEVNKAVQKWRGLGYEIGVIDMFNDADFNAAASDAYYGWCMSDAIHPKKAGYLQWWTPYFEAYLCNELNKA